MVKGIKALAVLAIMGAMTAPAFCEEVDAAASEAAKTESAVTVPAPEAVTPAASVSSEVVSIDVEKSTLVVKDGLNETVILVSPETKINKGETVLGLSDLKAADKVNVVSKADAAGNEVAESIAVVAE